MPDEIFDFGDILLGDFEARTGRNFEVDGELSSISFWEEGQTEEWGNSQTHQERSADGGYGEGRAA